MKKKASVLIVDDNAGLCKTLSFVLGRKGYGVTTANDGAEAIAIVEERPFDIVFMDVIMPFMNGVETYERMKVIRPEAMVVMMTAYAVEDMVQEALNNNAYTCLYKPLDMAEVLRLIKEIKEGKQKAG